MSPSLFLDWKLLSGPPLSGPWGQTASVSNASSLLTICDSFSNMHFVVYTGAQGSVLWSLMPIMPCLILYILVLLIHSLFKPQMVKKSTFLVHVFPLYALMVTSSAHVSTTLMFNALLSALIPCTIINNLLTYPRIIWLIPHGYLFSFVC